MDWLKKMNSAIKYVEENLDNEIEYKKAADMLCCSVFHFQKIFTMMAGVPVSEYIRRRRLTKAAYELQNANIKIIDLALKYGYSSPTAFNRAFTAIHGLSPTSARKEGVALKAYPPISFQITIKGAVEMNYKIVKKDAFRVVGVKLSTTMENEECFKAIPEFYGKFHTGDIKPALCEIMVGEPDGILGISVNEDFYSSPTFDYYIAVATDKAVPAGACEHIIPAATWAVFECIGPMPHAIQEMQKRILTEWLPTSGYEYGAAPDIEVYPNEDATTENYRSEIWLPIQKSAK